MTSFKAHFPPGPPQLPIIGNGHNMTGGDFIHRSLWDHREKYGKVSYFRLGGKDIISLNTYEAIREALESPETSRVLNTRPLSFIGNYPLRGDVMFSQYSEEWQHLRCTVQKGILSTIHQSKEITAALNDEFDHFKSVLRDYNGKSFNPRPLINRSATNSIVTMLVGRRFEYDHPVIRLYQEYGVHAIPLFQSKVVLTVMPWIRHLPFGLGAHYHNVERLKRELSKYLLYDVKEESETDGEERVGMIYELLRAQKKHGTIKDENIESMIIESHSAGIASMATHFRALVYYLIHHPHVQARVYREIVEVLGKNERPCVEDQERMPYTTATILEMLRRATPAPISFPRSNLADMTLFDYQIPKGTIVLANHWKIHHDEETWPEPWAFKPERLLDNDGKLLPKDHKLMQVMMPFGVGGRSCIGEAFALSRLFLYLVNTLQSFEIYNDSMEPGSEAHPRDSDRDLLLEVPPFEMFVRERP